MHPTCKILREVILLTTLTTSRRSYWRTEVAAILALLVFVAAMQIAAPLFATGLSEEVQLPIGVALAVIPAVLWMIVFYAQDRSEPEPRQFVIGVAILAALLAAAVGQPLLTGFFRIDSWIHHDPLTEFLGSVLVIGLIQELLKFAAVRFSMYYSDEFDQRIDGVLYGTAAGIGYATMLNLSTVFAAGGFADVGAGVVRIVITALVHSAVGGLIGFFLARARFDNEPVWWMPAGVLLAALINGAVAWLGSEFSRSALVLDATGLATAGFNPWPALALNAVVAAALSALVFTLMRRAGERPEAPRLDGRDTLSVVVTLAVAALTLAAGLIVRNSIEARVKVHSDPSGVRFAYPDGWRLDTKRAADGLLKVHDSGSGAAFELRAVAVEAGLSDKSAIAQVASSLSLNRAREWTAYRNFDLISTPSGMTGSFAFVTSAGTPLQESLPIVMLGEDRFVRKDGRVYVLTVVASQSGRDRAHAAFERFAASAMLP